MTRRLRTGAWLALKRLRAMWPLNLATVIVLGALIGVWTGIPLYAESASARLLSVEVEDAAADGVPFGYLMSYNRLSGGNKAWDAFEPINSLLEHENTPFGSTVTAQRRVFTSITFDVVTGGGDVVESDDPGLDDGLIASGVPFASTTAFDETATLLQGRFARAATSVDEPIEVMVDGRFAETNGLAVGQSVHIVNRRLELDDPKRSIDVRITGIWAPPEQAAVQDGAVDAPPDPANRFLRSGALTGALVVPESTLAEVINPLTEATLTNGQWLVLLDSGAVTTDAVDTLLANTETISRQVDDLMRGARVLVSPENSLEGFQQDVADLNRGLTLFSLPTLALALAVAGLVIGMRWNQRRREVAMLRRRGVTAGHIVSETLFEAAVLAVGGAAIGVLVARFVATLMARTETFLRLGSGVELDLAMNSRSWRALVVASLVLALLVAAPSLGAFRERLLSPSRRSDGDNARPWLQRTGFDIALVVGIAFFSWFLLQRTELSGNILDDPVIILLPAATALAAGLVALRLMPRLLRSGASLLERTDSSAALLVLRRGARVPAAVNAPLLLLVITSALAIYTGSLARTLDLQLLDAAHHQVGALNSVNTDPTSQLGQRFEVVDGETQPLPAGGPSVSSEAINQVWGVDAASRFLRLPARLSGTPRGGPVPVNFTGIDTASFGDVAFWRADYATRSLSDLMARLDATPDSVLVPRTVLRAAGLQLGDVVTISVTEGGQRTAIDMVIVGSFDQFPMWTPGDDLAPAVAKLADYQARSGAGVATNVLFTADDGLVDQAQTRADFSRLGVSTATPRQPDSIIERVQLRPERQGIFGLLTVSFVLSAALAVAGFVFYAVFGFSRQLTELGVLRALGMPRRDLRTLISLDLLIVAAIGIGVGTLSGLAMARWYVPRLVSQPVGSAPRMLEEIDWSAAIGIPLALSVVLAGTTVVLLFALRRIRLFEAIKIGADA